MRKKLSLILFLHLLFLLRSVAQCVMGPNDFDQASFDVADNSSIVIDATGNPCIAYKDGGNGGKATVRRYNGVKWETVGSMGFTPGTANATKLCKAPNGDLYLVYSDGSNANRATVMKYSGNSWNVVGNAGFSAIAINGVSIAIDANGAPYVVLSGSTNIPVVMKFNGTIWTVIGSFPYYAQGVASIALDLTGNPYIAYRDNSSKISVAKYTGSSWNLVGGGSLTTNSSIDPTIVFHINGEPYVSFREFTNNPHASVMRFNGTSWIYVGTPMFYSGIANILMTLDASGTPYVIFNDQTYGPNGNNTVMKLNGSSWVNVSPNGSAGRYNTAITTDASGTLYTSCIGMGSGTQKVEVKKFNGSTWVRVGTAGITNEDGLEPAMVLDPSDTPYIFFGDMTQSGKGTVMKHNGTSWVNVGSPGFTPTTFNNYPGGLSIKITPSGIPYVLYSDNINYFKATVARFISGAWQILGGISPDQAGSPCMAINSLGEVFVAYVDNMNTGKCTVVKYNGSSWTTVGAPNFSPLAGGVVMTLDGSGNPHVLISDQTLSGKCTLMKYNGSSWVTIGNPGFTPSNPGHLSLVVDGNNTPHVAFITNISAGSGQLIVMKYNGSNWVNEGLPNFPNGNAAYVKLAIDGSNNLYVSYKDVVNNNKVTLMKYNGISWNPVGSTGFSAGFAESISLAVNSSGIPVVAFNNGGVFVYKFDQIVGVSSNTIICGNNNNINLSASGGGTYSWLGPNGFTSSLQNPVIPNSTVVNSGNYHLAVTNGSCVSNKVTNILINPLPIVNVNNNVTTCNGASSTLSVSGTAATYSWSTGATTSSINVAPGATTVYTVTGTSSNSCTATNTIQVVVNQTPTLSISANSTICVGSSASINAAGANSYSWTTGATTASISVTPTITTTYSITGINFNCSSTKSVVVTVNQNCQDVWPGDANSDGLVDNTDVLELGLHFTQTGPARATTSNAWQSYFSNNWTGTISNGKNKNHSDCNGDGTINNNDTLAIYNNCGLTHAFKPAEQNVVNPQLSVVPDQTVVNAGSWGTSSLFLGEASAPIYNVNGLAFTVSFDQNLIDANNFYIEYPTSFINAGNQNLKFSKLDFSNGKLYTATTHTITNNVSGNGKVAILHYKMKSPVSTSEVLNIDIIQAKQSNSWGALIPLTASSATVVSVGMDELSNGSRIGIYPNPANSSVIVHSSSTLEKIELFSVTGQLVLSETASGNQHQLSLTEVANGVYFVTVYDTYQKVTRKKLVVQR